MADKITTEKEIIHNMKFHDVIDTEIATVLRVSSGWIYKFKDQSCCFSPDILCVETKICNQGDQS